jgi:p24 family protein delta-1
VTVTTPSGSTQYSKQDSNTGKFAFSTAQEGEYRLCFANTAMSTKTVKFSFDTGVSAKDYTTVAKKDNLKPLEVELRRLEDTTAEVHDELVAMRERHESLQALNDSTQSRMLYFSIASMTGLVLLGVSQIWYLRSYFKRKHIID